MRHYVVVFLESRIFKGTWVTDHFVREEPREDVPDLPDSAGIHRYTHSNLLKRLEQWENVPAPDPSWTLEECLLGKVAMLTALWYDASGQTPQRMVRYPLSPRLPPDD